MGLCVNHWRMNKKHGSPVAARGLAAINRGVPAIERFNSGVRKTDSCWLWLLSKDKDGYGMFRGDVAGLMYHKAHRFSYAYHTGEIVPKGAFVMHRCDNPSCVNPDHLKIGTPLDNTADMIGKGRRMDMRSHAEKVAKLTPEQVRAILPDRREYADIAKDYGVVKAAIYLVKNRKTHKYVDVSGIEIFKAKRGAWRRSKSFERKE